MSQTAFILIAFILSLIAIYLIYFRKRQKTGYAPPPAYRSKPGSAGEESKTATSPAPPPFVPETPKDDNLAFKKRLSTILLTVCFVSIIVFKEETVITSLCVTTIGVIVGYWFKN